MDDDRKRSIRHQLKWWGPTVVIVGVLVGLKDDPAAVRIARHFFPSTGDPQLPMLSVLFAIMLPGYLLFSSFVDVIEMAARDGVRPNLLRLLAYTALELDGPDARRHRMVIFGIGGVYLASIIWWIAYAARHGL
jgi:hypothetical protein